MHRRSTAPLTMLPAVAETKKPTGRRSLNRGQAPPVPLADPHDVEDTDQLNIFICVEPQ